MLKAPIHSSAAFMRFLPEGQTLEAQRPSVASHRAVWGQEATVAAQKRLGFDVGGTPRIQLFHKNGLYSIDACVCVVRL